LSFTIIVAHLPTPTVNCSVYRAASGTLPLSHMEGMSRLAGHMSWVITLNKLTIAMRRYIVS
jgi:hypothetical protein